MLGKFSMCFAVKDLGEQNSYYQLRVYDQDFALNKNQFDQLDSFFKVYDVNLDGVIDRKEIFQLFQPDEEGLKNPSEKEIQDLLELADFDKNGVLSFSEFISLGFLNTKDDGDESMCKNDYDTSTYQLNNNKSTNFQKYL